MPFDFCKTEIPDVILIRPKQFHDNRGSYLETFKASDFRKNKISCNFVQEGHSVSKKGVIRGLHYQLDPKSQGKLVRVIRGSIFDVAVDIRKGSPYFGKYVAFELSEKNRHMLWLPKGFAHGLCSLINHTEISYLMTAEYSKEHEAGIIWNDPAINIPWPISNPIISEKDSQLSAFKDATINFKYLN